MLSLEDRSDDHLQQLLAPLEKYLGNKLYRNILSNHPKRSFEHNVTFTIDSVLPYGIGQDVKSTFQVLDQGKTLRIHGNGWKKKAFAYTITRSTVLEFEFKSSAQGDVHAIGFDRDEATHDTATTYPFVIYGSQKGGYAPGLENYRDYSGTQFKRYRIMVGEILHEKLKPEDNDDWSLNEEVSHLIFVNDHDVANPTSESVISNVIVYNNTLNREGRWPTIQEVRDQGKQIIITGNDHQSSTIWPLDFYYGLARNKATNFYISNGIGFIGDADAKTEDPHSAQTGPFVSYNYEARSLLDPTSPAGFLTPAGIADRFRFNISQVSIDFLNSQEDTSQCPGAGSDVCSAPDKRVAAAVWSWHEGQPEDVLLGAQDNGEDAALFDGNSGRWVSQDPSESHYFACVRSRRFNAAGQVEGSEEQWRITETKGPWKDANKACVELNLSLPSNESPYTFGVPTSGFQNEKLRRALVEFRKKPGRENANVWLAYHDQGSPGRWKAIKTVPFQFDRTNVLDFKGTGAIEVKGFGSIAPTTEITIEFWQKAAGFDYQSTLHLVPDVGTNRINVHVPYKDGKVYWHFGNFPNGGALSYMPPVPVVGEWHHFAFVASKKGNYMRIYRNGVLEAAKVGMTPFIPLNQSISIGGGVGDFYNGQLAELKIWNVARSASEISSGLWQETLGTETGLVSYWPMDEGSGRNFRNVANNNYPGNFNGEAAKWMNIARIPSQPAISHIFKSNPQAYRLTVTGERGRRYSLEQSDTLRNWEILSELTAESETFSFDVEDTNKPRMFYRVIVK